MGLDMSVYRVCKPNLDEKKTYDRNELNGVVIEEEDANNPMVRQLIPYCAKVRVISHYYDLEKIGKDYGLTGVSIGGWSCSGEVSATTFYGNKGTKRESVVLPDGLVDREYTIDRAGICYVCDIDEVHYWRKAYDIRNWFYEHISEPVENTGYYILSEKLLRDFNKRFPEDRLPVEAPNEDYALAYWEWY